MRKKNKYGKEISPICTSKKITIEGFRKPLKHENILQPNKGGEEGTLGNGGEKHSNCANKGEVDDGWWQLIYDQESRNLPNIFFCNFKECYQLITTTIIFIIKKRYLEKQRFLATLETTASGAHFEKVNQ